MPKSKSGRIIKSIIQIVIFMGLLFLGIFIRMYYITLNEITVKEQLIKQTKEATVFLQGLSLPLAADKWYPAFLSRLFLVFGIKDQVILYAAFALFGISYLFLYIMVKNTMQKALAYVICLYYVIDIMQIQKFCTFDSFIFRNTLLYGFLFLFIKFSIWSNKKLKKDGILLFSIFVSMLLAYGIKKYVTYEMIPILLILLLLLHYFRILYIRWKQPVMEEQGMEQRELETGITEIENSNVLINVNLEIKEPDKLDFPYHFEKEELKYDFEDL